MKIIRARKADVQTISSLNNLFHLNISGFKWNTEYWIKSHLKDYFVLIEGNKIIGTICIVPDKDECNIEAVSVSPKNQRKGNGRRLIEFAKKYALRNKCHKLTVNSFYEYHLESFYRKLGFLEENKPGVYNKHKYYQFYMNLKPIS